jgi:hypothetical protein
MTTLQAVFLGMMLAWTPSVVLLAFQFPQSLLAPRLETGPHHQQSCTERHQEKARPVRSEPQESQAAPSRLQSAANRPGGIRATERSPPNSRARHVQDAAENEQRAKPHQKRSRLRSSVASSFRRRQCWAFSVVWAMWCDQFEILGGFGPSSSIRLAASWR